MALFDFEKRNGLQYGTVGDECYQCRKDNRFNDEYEPEYLDYKVVYKLWINNQSHCLCFDCFKKTLGNYVLINPDEIIPDVEEITEPETVEEEKPKSKKSSKKKEEDK